MTEREPQRLIRWSPLDRLPDDLIVEALHDDREGLRVLLQPARLESPLPWVRVTFPSFVGYRSFDESYRLRLWEERAGSGGSLGLWIVENSRWLAWSVDEARGTLDAERLTHYAIYTGDDCVDVLSADPPRVEWLGGATT